MVLICCNRDCRFFAVQRAPRRMHLGDGLYLGQVECECGREPWQHRPGQELPPPLVEVVGG
jgi:hypothetical protein